MANTYLNVKYDNSVNVNVPTKETLDNTVVKKTGDTMTGELDVTIDASKTEIKGDRITIQKTNDITTKSEIVTKLPNDRGSYNTLAIVTRQNIDAFNDIPRVFFGYVIEDQNYASTADLSPVKLTNISNGVLDSDVATYGQIKNFSSDISTLQSDVSSLSTGVDSCKSDITDLQTFNTNLQFDLLNLINYIYNLTLSASSWSSNGTYTVSNLTKPNTFPSTLSLNLTNALILMSPSQSITETQLQALQNANIICGNQTQNSFTLKATGVVPTIDIPVTFSINMGCNKVV